MDRAKLRRALVKRAIGYPLFVAALLALFWVVAVRMPGRSFVGSLPPLTESEVASRERLRSDVEFFATTIGERNLTRPGSLDSAARHIEATLRELGYVIDTQRYVATSGGQRRDFVNLEATLPGTHPASEIIVIGAHYDSVIESPGADDNASGTASLLELARMFAGRPRERTLRFVAFANEEPPFF